MLYSAKEDNNKIHNCEYVDIEYYFRWSSWSMTFAGSQSLKLLVDQGSHQTDGNLVLKGTIPVQKGPD